jgi:hypothetical protein
VEGSVCGDSPQNTNRPPSSTAWRIIMDGTQGTRLASRQLQPGHYRFARPQKSITWLPAVSSCSQSALVRKSRLCDNFPQADAGGRFDENATFKFAGSFVYFSRSLSGTGTQFRRPLL